MTGTPPSTSTSARALLAEAVVSASPELATLPAYTFSVDTAQTVNVTRPYSHTSSSDDATASASTVDRPVRDIVELM
ncbi:hypothetical protein BGZ67_000392 [Mortierella alpina]|nr:hypothetical protein BGZ67_000392 [Mortierella alpina]